jgi:predicted metalloprotease with PDZ domain
VLADVIAALQAVAPHDWERFFRERVYTVTEHAPIGGITAGGWHVAWVDSLGPLGAASESANKRVEESYTLGLELADDGRVRDIVPGSPADLAGVAPDMKVIAVNGRRYEKDVLRDAIAASKASGRVELLCENKEFFRMFTLGYRDGLRYPAIARDPAHEDLVSEVLAAHAKRD